MQESVALLELQDIDVEILRATKRLDELPEKRAILEIRAKQREAQALHDKSDLLVRKLEAEVKARQDEVELVNDKLAVEQKKVMETSDHRAVQSITREMDGLKRRRDKLEMESLQFMDRVEKAKAQRSTIDEHIARLADKEQQLIERFKVAGGELQGEIARLERRRALAEKAVAGTMLEKYEACRESKGGVGVGRLDGVVCSACRMELPAERIAELSDGPDVGVCPQCRRLIVVRWESVE